MTSPRYVTVGEKSSWRCDSDTFLHSLPFCILFNFCILFHFAFCAILHSVPFCIPSSSQQMSCILSSSVQLHCNITVIFCHSNAKPLCDVPTYWGSQIFGNLVFGEQNDCKEVEISDTVSKKVQYSDFN